MLPEGVFPRGGHDPGTEVDIDADGTITWAAPGPPPGKADITVLASLTTRSGSRYGAGAPVRMSDDEARELAAQGLVRIDATGPPTTPR